MKEKEVVIGIVIAMVIFIPTVIIHSFAFELPHRVYSSLIMFSVMFFTLCIIGNNKRNKQQGSRGSKPKGK